MLEGVRVLDLADGGATLCGQILADLGAEVVLIEPPGGISLRRLRPFVDDVAHPDRSLAFWASNRGKRSAVLDLDTAEGAAALLALAAEADLVIESLPPGRLDHAALRAVNPRLSVISISAYGATGPKAHWPAHDLTAEAASGALTLTGDADRPPCQQCVVPQAFRQAAADAAVAALAALEHRERTGVGVHADIAAQTAQMLGAQQLVLSEAWGDRVVTRSGGGVVQGGAAFRFIYPCADGFVSVTLLFGSTFGEYSRRLFEVLVEEGCAEPSLLEQDCALFAVRLRSGEADPAELHTAQEAVARWAASHTKAELTELAAARRLLIVPVASTADVRASAQLAARRFWQEVHHDELGRTVTYPGPFAQFSAAPVGAWRRAPLLGEHTREVLASVRAGPPPAPTPAAAAVPALAPRPLAGLKVLDFTWVVAGPMAVRYLTDCGASVVRVESAARPDSLRAVTPFHRGVPDPNRSGVHASLNCDKLTIALDLRNPAAREAALDLVRWADVVVENYSPKAMRGFGLDYESLRAVKPDLVMVSSCLNGQTGPDAGLAGYGTMGAQLAGFGALAGWPDRDPAGPFGAYTDYVAPRFAALSILAALAHRRRTGEGQYIDLSQSEATLQLLGPALLDLEVNGRVAERLGNASPDVAPHGVYPCRGEDRWAAIVADTDERFARLDKVIGAGWASDPRFADNDARLAHRSALDADIAAWTARRPVEEVEAVLTAAGVPAHRALTAFEVRSDPQLAAREHLTEAEHPELGPVWVENSRLRFDGVDTRPRRAGVLIGQHTEQVLRELLGYDEARIASLAAAGALR
ncbi:MAG: CoA transferase [Acidimicrobiales bacterium]